MRSRPRPLRPLGADAREHLVARRADVERVALRIGHCRSPSRSRLSSSTWTARLAEDPEQGLLGVAGDDRADLVGRHAARLRRPVRPGTRPPPG